MSTADRIEELEEIVKEKKHGPGCGYLLSFATGLGLGIAKAADYDLGEAEIYMIGSIPVIGGLIGIVKGAKRSYSNENPAPIQAIKSVSAGIESGIKYSLGTGIALAIGYAAGFGGMNIIKYNE